MFPPQSRNGKEYSMTARSTTGRKSTSYVKYQTQCKTVNRNFPAFSMILTGRGHTHFLEMSSRLPNYNFSRPALSSARLPKHCSHCHFHLSKDQSILILLSSHACRASSALARCLTIANFPSGTASRQWTAGTATQLLRNRRRRQYPSTCFMHQKQLSTASRSHSQALPSTTRPTL